MTQEECNQEYLESLKELETALQNVERLSYRLHHGAKYYGQPQEVYEEGEKVHNAIWHAGEDFLEFLEKIPELQNR